MKILVVDVGGNHVKLLATDQRVERKIPSGPSFTPGEMMDQVLPLVQDWPYEAVTIGCPAAIINGKMVLPPHNLGPGWVDFDFPARFGRPVKLINDAAMQALGSYQGGRMLFLGLGTGLGSALVWDGQVIPLELAHLPYRKKRTYEDYLGNRGLEGMGKKKWQRALVDVVDRFRQAFLVDEVVLGGGNSRKLESLPPGSRRGDNGNAFVGGFRLWEPDFQLEKPHEPRASLDLPDQGS